MDFLIQPDSLKKASYWEPDCEVLDTGLGNSAKTLIIKRPGGIPALAPRHRLRPHNAPNLLQLSAIDLNKCDEELKKLRDVKVEDVETLLGENRIYYDLWLKQRFPRKVN